MRNLFLDVLVLALLFIEPHLLLTVFAWFIFCTSDRTKVIAQARSARAIAFRDGYACIKNHANMVVS